MKKKILLISLMGILLVGLVIASMPEGVFKEFVGRFNPNADEILLRARGLNSINVEIGGIECQGVPIQSCSMVDCDENFCYATPTQENLVNYQIAIKKEYCDKYTYDEYEQVNGCNKIKSWTDKEMVDMVLSRLNISATNYARAEELRGK